ncbi:MAG TPA: septal ring lytic transglycosylase RlpA family protein [Pseudomonadales bacterium]|jgi:rare lipoprotein A|nr:septal ring lytic transglycosylase RlpA family protein [Pseudomonadales bacterium]HRG50573.1 septal ring lytic transglycosylase RlpA family protein [Pseudomonadales bacterium]
MSNLNWQRHFPCNHTSTLPRLLGAVLVSMSVLTLTACTSGGSSGGRYAQDQDSLPDDGRILDPDNIPDAVPKLEPRSAGGNKSPYTVLGETYQVMPQSNGYTATGKVSWYGKKFHGYKTSNGEIYDMYKMSAAHRNLPIPSYVRVTNLSNDRTAIVRVNDRGPFHSERIMDLSYAAAVKLDIVRSGTATVRLEAIDPSNYDYAAGEAARDRLHSTKTKSAAASARTTNSHDLPQKTPTATGSAYLQAGAFRNQDSAFALRDQLKTLTGQAVNVDSIGGFYKVRIGPLDPAEIRNISELLMQRDLPKPQVVYF